MADSAKAAVLDEMISDARGRISRLKDGLELEEKYLVDLMTRRSALEEQAARSDGQGDILQLEKKPPDAPQGLCEAVAGVTVPDAVKTVLESRGRAMRARDIAATLLAAGFKTQGKNGLLPSVLSALGRRNDLFKKIRRGTYKLTVPAQQ